MKKLFILLALLFTGVACFGKENFSSIGKEIYKYNDTHYILSSIKQEKDNYWHITITVLNNSFSYDLEYRYEYNNKDSSDEPAVLTLFLFDKTITDIMIAPINEYYARIIY